MPAIVRWCARSSLGKLSCRVFLLFLVIAATVAPAPAGAFMYPAAPRVCPGGWCPCPYYTDNVDLGVALIRTNSDGHTALWLRDAGIFIFMDQPTADVTPDGPLVSIWVYQDNGGLPTRKDDYCQLCSPQDFANHTCTASTILE